MPHETSVQEQKHLQQCICTRNILFSKLFLTSKRILLKKERKKKMKPEYTGSKQEPRNKLRIKITKIKELQKRRTIRNPKVL
jgi:hypothetical protein